MNLVEHLENAHAAISINTVVGRPGTTIPTYPSERERIPITKNTGLWTFRNKEGKNLYRTMKRNTPPPIERKTFCEIFCIFSIIRKLYYLCC